MTELMEVHGRQYFVSLTGRQKALSHLHKAARPDARDSNLDSHHMLPMVPNVYCFILLEVTYTQISTLITLYILRNRN